MRHVFSMRKSIASRLNTRITFLNRVVSRDMCGGPIDDWIFGFTCYAEVRGISGKEDVQNGLEYSVNMYRITIRWRRDVDASGRVVLGDGTALDIRSVTDPTGRREILVIDAERNSVEGASIEHLY